MTGRATSPVVRSMLASLSFVCSWLISLLLEGLRAPVWALAINAVVILVNLAILIGALHFATREDQGQDRREGGGGSPRRGPERPTPSSDTCEPDWWPEFASQLERYAANRERGRAPASA